MRFFSETQRFNQWWLKLIMISALLVVAGALISGYQTIETHEKEMFLYTSIGLSLFMILVTMFVFNIRLITKIDEMGIHYKFHPIQRKHRIISWNDMENCYVREYKPISEYGGWGYKIGLVRRSGAYNIKGNKGIQINLKSGRNLLIGTQKEHDAKRVIAHFTETQKEHA